MNKTLLLILCDFLLITLISLVNWNGVQDLDPTRAPPREAGPELAREETPDADAVAALHLALEAGEADRAALETALEERDLRLGELRDTIARREAEAAELARERERLDTSLTEARRTVDAVTGRLTQATEEAALARARLEEANRDAGRSREEAERLARSLEETERRRAAVEEEARLAVRRAELVETERALLRENLDALRAEVEVARADAQSQREQAGRLAEDVGRLAEQSGSLREEFLAAQPINANTLFEQFLAGRVEVRLQAGRDSAFGPIQRDRAVRSALVSDGTQVFALVHLQDTPFPPGETPAEWTTAAGSVGRLGVFAPAGEIRVLALDPRVALVPIAPEAVAAAGARTYRLAAEPFRFPEAVLVSAGGRAYGEVEFRLDPRNPRYIRMPGNVINRLLGDFSPSRGDLVFSKTGELLGIMVTATHCLLVGELAGAETIPLRDGEGPRIRDALRALRERLGTLPAFVR